MILQYIASSGNKYDLNTNGSLVKSANFHTWEWGAIGTTLQYGMRVSDFKRDPAVYAASLVVHGPYAKRKKLLDDLHEEFENDIRNDNPGKIIWGDYYINCFITKSETAADKTFTRTDNNIEIFCPYPYWIRDNKKSFYPLTAPGAETFLDYPYDYDYDYAFGEVGTAVWETGFPFPSAFELTIYGPATNPKVTIAGHPYQINVTLEDGEYLILNSKNNTITQYLLSGQQENVFDNRDKSNSVFEPIPGGDIDFIWSGAFGFDLTLYNERSEPRWLS